MQLTKTQAEFHDRFAICANLVENGFDVYLPATGTYSTVMVRKAGKSYMVEIGSPGATAFETDAEILAHVINGEVIYVTIPEEASNVLKMRILPPVQLKDQTPITERRCIVCGRDLHLQVKRGRPRKCCSHECFMNWLRIKRGSRFEHTYSNLPQPAPASSVPKSPTTLAEMPFAEREIPIDKIPDAYAFIDDVLAGASKPVSSDQTEQPSSLDVEI